MPPCSRSDSHQTTLPYLTLQSHSQRRKIMPTRRTTRSNSPATTNDDATSLAAETPTRRSTRRAVVMSSGKRRRTEESDQDSVTEVKRPRRARVKAVNPALPPTKNDSTTTRTSIAPSTEEATPKDGKDVANSENVPMEVEQQLEESPDVDMGEKAQSNNNDSAETNNGTKENLLNEDHPVHESTTTAPAENTTSSSGETMANSHASVATTQPHVPPVGRLRMPSQHTPGKPLHETKVLREPLVEEDSVIDVPSQRRTKIVPERKPSTPDEQTPTKENGQSHDNTDAALPSRREEEGPSTTAPPRTPGQAFSFSRIANDLFSPGTTMMMGRPPINNDTMDETEIVEDEENTTTTWLNKNAWVLFGWVLLAQLALAAMGVGPITGTAESMRSFYFSVLGKNVPNVPVVPSGVESISADPSVNVSLIEEKLAIRDNNLRVAESNRQVEAENAKSEAIAKRRQQQIVRVEKINEQRFSENEKIYEEAQALQKSLHALEESKLSLEHSQSVFRERIVKMMSAWEEKKAALDSTLQTKVDSKNAANESLESFQAHVQQRAEIMEELMEIFEGIVQKEAILESRSELDRARELLEPGEEEFILDIFSISLWKPRTPAECPEVESEVSDVPKKIGVTHENAETMVGKLKRQIIQEANEMKNFRELRLQVEEMLEKGKAGLSFGYISETIPSEPVYVVEESDAEFDKRDAMSVSGYPGMDEIEDLVWERVHAEHSDGTGKRDFAALTNGGKILGASPSLVDDLPVINRLQSLMAVNSYGHGPEAALTPTWPPAALGQCWAFEKDKRRSKYTSEGVLAGLLVQLAEPIHIGSVSIEHPPPELTDKPNSAIKAFRVFGFEEADASGRAWELGSFTYDIWDQSRPSRQEFLISESNAPKFAAVELAIDGNWGAQVSCLYRFRVHARQSLEESEIED